MSEETRNLFPKDMKYVEALPIANYIEELKQENTQLKEQLEKIQNEPLTDRRSRIDSVVANIYSESKKQTQRIERLESVLKEIREYIGKYDVFKEFSFPLMKRAEENQVKSSIKYEFDKSIKKDLLEIIDKGIGEDK